MKTLKIALVCDHFLPRIGGLELQVWDLAKALQSHGHQVEIYTTTPGAPLMEEIRIHRLSAPLLPGFKIPIGRKAFRVLRTLLQEEPVDLVHCHSSVISPLAYGTVKLCHDLNIPCILTCHSLLKVSSITFRWLNPFIGWQKWHCLLSAVSRNAAEGLRRAASGRQVHLLPNGIKPESWKVLPQSKTGIHVVSVMRLNRKKRPQDLIKAIPLLLTQIPSSIPVHFHLVGNGPFEKTVRHLAAKKNLAKSLTFYGHLSRDEIRRLFSIADLFVLPSRKESFGIAALEARCAGIPVVGLKGSGLEDVIESGEQGILAANFKEWVQAIRQLIVNEPLRRSLSEKSTREIEHFSWKRSVERHVALYQQAIEWIQEERIAI